MNIGKEISADQREQIYNEIWSEPVSKVAPRYGISDTAFRKRCVELWDIPVPEAGYWAKKRAGHVVHQPKLHKYPSDSARRYVYGYTVSYKELASLPSEVLYSEEPLYVFSDKTKALLNRIATQENICDDSKKPSKEIREEFIKWKEKNNVSAWADRAICIFNGLRQQIHDLEGSVCIGFDDKGLSIIGIIYICKESFNFQLAPNEDLLCIAVQWQKWWGLYDTNKPNDLFFSDLPEKTLESQLGNIIYQLFVIAGKRMQGKEIERREEKQRQEELAFQRKIAPLVEEENKKVNKALEDAENYKKACEIRTYAEAYLNKNGAQFDKHPEYKTYYDWLIARADWIDPLIENDYNALLERIQKNR